MTFPIPGQMFQFSWDAHGPLQDSDAHLITMSGPDDLCGSRDTPFRSSENIHTCSGWSPTGQKYSLSVRAVNCGGEGPASDLASVWLQSKEIRSHCLHFVCVHDTQFYCVFSHTRCYIDSLNGIPSYALQNSCPRIEKNRKWL